VLSAAWQYAARTRWISIECALIKDLNDQAGRADHLRESLAGRLTHVNVIPLNPGPGSRWTASKPQDWRASRRLEARGIPVTVRDTRGHEIDDASGQPVALAGTDSPLDQAATIDGGH
jgi:23S rRNA (adenine2503-C2)-methyltransferase